MSTAFWPTQEHWSVAIPLQTPHVRLDCLAETGFVALRNAPFDVPSSEWESLEYMDWKSGGDTNFAPLASADGELDCRGFWDKGKTDKDALWTSNAASAPTLKKYVDSLVQTSVVFASSNWSHKIMNRLCATFTVMTTTVSIRTMKAGSFVPGWNSPTALTAICCLWITGQMVCQTGQQNAVCR